MLRSVVDAGGSRIREARAARWLRPSSLAAAILLLSACPSFDPPVYYQEDFEGCAGACGWEIAGPGTAAIVATIHPGEHGLRLGGDVTVTHRFEPPLDGSSLTWVTDGDVQLSVTPDDADASEVAVAPQPPAVDEDGDPIVEEVDGGFRPHSASLGNQLSTALRSVSFHHRAESPPAIVDVVQVLGINTNPGCF